MAERCAHFHGVCGPRCIQPAGHTGHHLYKCAGASCPGLPWAASAAPHPASCSRPACPYCGAPDGDGGCANCRAEAYERGTE